jgi:hypothetical protein
MQLVSNRSKEKNQKRETASLQSPVLQPQRDSHPPQTDLVGFQNVLFMGRK